MIFENQIKFISLNINSSKFWRKSFNEKNLSDDEIYSIKTSKLLLLILDLF
jgi:hypothetical protein